MQQKKSKLLGRQVEVEWEDAWFSDRYWTQEEAQTAPPHILRTIGWVLRDNREGISISPEFIQDQDRFRGLHHISRKMIRKVTPLKK